MGACAAAADELAASRRLIAALYLERNALGERLGTAKRESDLLKELADTRERENEALTRALDASSRADAANIALIRKQDETIAELKRSRRSPWKRLGDILIGVAAGAVLR